MNARMGLLATVLAIGLSGTAFAGDRDDILASCAANLGLSAAGCNCVADTAMNEFNEQEFAFFMAVIRDDRDAQMAAMGQMTPEEMTSVGERMNEIPGKCAG